MLDKATKLWLKSPESKEEILSLVGDENFESGNYTAKLEFGQKEDLYIYSIFVVRYGDDKIFWRTFPYDDFQDHYKEAMDNPIIWAIDVAMMVDSIRILTEDMWIDKVQQVKNRCARIADCQCRYRA